MPRPKQFRTASADRTESAIRFARHAESLGLDSTTTGRSSQSSEAVEAKFVTPQDPVIKTAHGGRLPAVPIDQALKLNELRDRMNGRDPRERSPVPSATRESKDGTLHGIPHNSRSFSSSKASERTDAPLWDSVLHSSTNPLFPQLPMWGPPSTLGTVQSWYFRASAAVLSLCFLLVIVLGSIFTAIPVAIRRIWCRMQLKDPMRERPFYEEEQRRKKARKKEEQQWAKASMGGTKQGATYLRADGYIATEGGPDRMVGDAGYYARRVGLDMEEFRVQTEDGFIISLLHLYDPREYTPASNNDRAPNSPDLVLSDFATDEETDGESGQQLRDGNRRYPVLLMHGLLQSAGAYCCTDDDSLAFYLAKQGYDVWLGNNRCGFEPEHTLLKHGDPRMWAWNIRQMGALDLPALISRVLHKTGFEKLALVAHSQGTTQTLVALAKEQRPDLGLKISVFCALAPAAYSGPLINKMYFKFMQVITPGMFRMLFGIHSFIPFMMSMHKILPGGFYGVLGYRVFSFMFDWTDLRWDRALRNRFFQFAPTYVSAESMRWWLGRECFAKQKCILSTRAEGKLEDQEDDEEELHEKHAGNQDALDGPLDCSREGHQHDDRGKFAWYDERAPPMAFWIGGLDGLVDGRRLLRRFDRGREPHVSVVHKKIIEGYEHLDVIWAIDSIEQVGKEVKEIIWKTMPSHSRGICRTVTGCDDRNVHDDEKNEKDETVVTDTARADNEDREAKEEEHKQVRSP